MVEWRPTNYVLYPWCIFDVAASLALSHKSHEISSTIYFFHHKHDGIVKTNKLNGRKWRKLLQNAIHLHSKKVENKSIELFRCVLRFIDIGCSKGFDWFSNPEMPFALAVVLMDNACSLILSLFHAQTLTLWSRCHHKNENTISGKFTANRNSRPSVPQSTSHIKYKFRRKNRNEKVLPQQAYKARILLKKNQIKKYIHKDSRDKVDNFYDNTISYTVAIPPSRIFHRWKHCFATWIMHSNCSTFYCLAYIQYGEDEDCAYTRSKFHMCHSPTDAASIRQTNTFHMVQIYK